MKRHFPLYGLLVVLLCACLASPAGAVRRNAAVQVDGRLLNAACYVDSGVTYVPLRALLDALGGWTLRWDSAAAQAAAVSGEGSLTADPAANTVTVNGRALSGRVTVENGRTYVPLRTVAETLGCGVAWDPYLSGAAVTSPGAPYDAASLFWLARIISAESSMEPAAGQLAVGNVVLNRVSSDRFPNSVAAVVFDRKDAVQFEPVTLGTVYNTPSETAVTAAKQALDGEIAVSGAMYFYAPALSQGVWINENCTYLCTIGGHRFYAVR